MNTTKIEWADKTWNPVTGCTAVDLGCDHCYAMRMAQRLAGRYGYPKRNPFKPTCHPDRLEEPLRWHKQAIIFVVSMGDLFHPDIPEAFILRVLNIIDRCGIEAEHSGKCNHRFMLLTKRPVRMLRIVNDWFASYIIRGIAPRISRMMMGISASDQATYDRRMEILASDTLHIKRFASLEPLVAPIDIEGYKFKLSTFPRMQWPQLIIVGGESGPGARPMYPDWARHIRDRCLARLIHFHFKQWGAWSWTYGGIPERACSCIVDGGHGHAEKMWRIGKKNAGRLLDGRKHN